MSAAKKLSGSALVITLLTVSVLAAAAFGAGQIFVSERSIISDFEDTHGAYYAAQAGLEEGLRRFRADRNIEGEIALPALAVGSVQVQASYRVPNPNLGSLGKDQVVEVDTSAISSQLTNLTLRAVRQSVDGNTALQVERVSLSGEFSQIVNLAGAQLVQNMVVPIQTNTASLRIKALGQGITSLCVLTGGLNCGDTGRGTPIDAGVTKITSTGSHGRAKRRLEAKINRSTGRLTSIFDYGLLSNETIQ